MMAKQTYTNDQFKEAVKSSFRMVEVLRKIGVKPRAGSYNLANKLIVDLNIDTSHFSRNRTFSALNYTEEQFIEAVKKSFSIIEVLRTIGVIGSGGNYAIAHRTIKRLGLDTSHFTGQGHLKGKQNIWRIAQPIENILIENYCGGITTNALRHRLFKNKIFDQKCSQCGLSNWNGSPLSLELEHKNGNRCDNRIENLAILCPNCHSQTHTFRRKKSSLQDLHLDDKKL